MSGHDLPHGPDASTRSEHAATTPAIDSESAGGTEPAASVGPTPTPAPTDTNGETDTDTNTNASAAATGIDSATESTATATADGRDSAVTETLVDPDRALDARRRTLGAGVTTGRRGALREGSGPATTRPRDGGTCSRTEVDR